MIIIFLWSAFLLGFHIHVHKIFWHTYICLGINSTLIFNIWLDITYALQCTDYSKVESLTHIVYHIYKFTCWWINMNIHVTVSGLLYIFYRNYNNRPCFSAISREGTWGDVQDNLGKQRAVKIWNTHNFENRFTGTIWTKIAH